MRACWFDEFGSPQDALQQGDWPTPEPGPGEVLVQNVLRRTKYTAIVRQTNSANAEVCLAGRRSSRNELFFY